MKQFNNKTITKSFTIVEVLIFVTLISLIFITISYIITFSLKNTKINEHKILATHYAEELKEWLRGEKEDDWNIFTTKGHVSGSQWCVNTIPIDISTLVGGPCGLDYSLHNNTFKRDLTLTNNVSPNPTQVTVNIIVEWKEDNNIYTIPINTVFSLWE